MAECGRNSNRHSPLGGCPWAGLAWQPGGGEAHGDTQSKVSLGDLGTDDAGEHLGKAREVQSHGGRHMCLARPQVNTPAPEGEVHTLMAVGPPQCRSLRSDAELGVDTVEEARRRAKDKRALPSI